MRIVELRYRILLTGLVVGGDQWYFGQYCGEPEHGFLYTSREEADYVASLARNPHRLADVEEYEIQPTNEENQP
jgi:hypothetical protein